MNKSEVIHIRCSDVTIRHLNKISEWTGMDKSAIIRGLIGKAYYDDHCRNLLQKFFDLERIGFDSTSYNARCDDKEKNGSGDVTDPRNAVEHPVSRHLHFNEFYEDFKHCKRTGLTRHHNSQEWKIILGEKLYNEFFRDAEIIWLQGKN